MNHPPAFAILLFITALVSAADPASRPAADPRDLAGKRIMILGDSITQDGRWVGFVEYYLQRQFPNADFDIINVGLSSETASGLSEPGHAGGAFVRPCIHERLTRALEKVKPRIVIACYGMNDGIYLGPDPKRMRAFQDGITKLVTQCQSAGARVILVTPPVFDPAASRPGVDPYDGVLADFSKWVLSAPFTDTLRVDLHSAMRDVLDDRRKAQPSFHFAGDGVHPDDLGHLVMAQVILRGLGAKVPDGDLDAELARMKGDPLLALINRRRSERSSAWMTWVGYTRERVVAPGGDIGAAEKRAADLQKQIDDLRRRPQARWFFNPSTSTTRATGPTSR